jgi:anaerobic carbon-monoxide dehydrogenase iron sulfur subunit
MKRVYQIEEYCMACRRCEVACIVEHSPGKDAVKAYRDPAKRVRNRAVFEEKGAVSFPLSCLHCADAPCIEACITGAMSRNARGAVVVDENRCVGCWMCVMVCPYGAIHREQRNRKVSWKCDLCQEKDTPACVEACVNRALIFEDDD